MSDRFHKNISQFYDSIELPGGFSFDHPETIKTIDSYYGGRFKTGQRDSLGRRKYFYNITKPACDVATKFIDLDTKDVLLNAQRAGDELKVWLMQRDFRHWMKENDFGMLLNEIAHDYPKYGTVVLKKLKDGSFKKVNIQNLRMDPSTDKLDNSDFVYEIHLMTVREMKDMGWDTSQVQGAFTTVYECYDYQLEGKPWKRRMLAHPFRKPSQDGNFHDAPEAQINEEDEFLPPILLNEDEVDELPYRELHWEKIPGRWLGFGFAEYLFDDQVRQNELANLKAKGLYFTALHLYQTKDNKVGRNALTEMENGDILKVSSEITPVANEERNLAAFSQEEQRWDKIAEQKTFSFDIARGENLPSRTPVGVASLSAGMVASFFELKRENFGLFLKKLLIKDVIPSFEKKSAKEHVLLFAGDDPELDKLDDTIVEIHVLKETIKFAKKNGFFPSNIELEKSRVRNELRSRKNRHLKIPKGFYENAKYLVDIIVTGEQMDTGVKANTIQIILQLLNNNPAVLQNPVTRSLVAQLAQLGGVNIHDLNITQDQGGEPQLALPQGGSLSLPNQGAGLIRGITAQ